MRKNARPTGFHNTTCNKCDAKAHSKSGSKHRRCGGKDKHGPRLPSEQRGTWS